MVMLTWKLSYDDFPIRVFLRVGTLRPIQSSQDSHSCVLTMCRRSHDITEPREPCRIASEPNKSSVASELPTLFLCGAGKLPQINMSA